MNDHTSLFFRGFICAVNLLNLIGSGAVFGADHHAAIEPKSTIVASARPARSGTADNGTLISLPSDSGKSAKQTKTSNTTAATTQTSKYPRPNEMLQGVVYDLKRTKDRKNRQCDIQNQLDIIKKFVNGSWIKKVDANDVIHYSELENYYCLPTRLGNSFFYREPVEESETPKILHSESLMDTKHWIAVYSGYVVAPFTGKFRFVGFGDAFLLVRFNNQVVLDYGWFSATMGEEITWFGDYKKSLAGSPETEAQSRLIKESSFFSKYRLEVLSSMQSMADLGLQRGTVLSVQKGQVIPIEVFFSDDFGVFKTMLFIEQLDSNGRPLKNNPKKLPLFRTTTHLPEHPTTEGFPDFEDDGPIWKVVDFRGKTIPASKYAKQDVKIGFQLDDGIETKQQTVASATTTKPKTAAPAVNEEDELPGVLYDLKQTADGSPTYLMDLQGGKQFNRLRTTLSVWNLPDTADTESIMVPYLKRFVLSNWPHKTDSVGVPSYNEFKQFFRSSVTPYKSFFYQPNTSSETAPKTFFNDGEISDAGWVGIHTGYVVAPFTGKFRFVGFGDDALVVRFNNQLVFDYGWHALSLGKKLDDTWDYRGILSGTAARTDPQNRLLLENPIYSQCKLETYFPSKCSNHGLGKGIPISVIKGRCYPIEILVTDIVSGGEFGMGLFIERLNSDGTPLKKDPANLPLFRTSSRLPNHSSGNIPDFDDDSPIWKIVNSKGKPIPSHKPPVIEEKQVAEEKKEAAASKKDELVAQEKQPVESTSQPQRDPNLKKVVSTTTRGNITTQTVTEYNGDTTIETVTTTEVNGDTTVQTTTITEMKNGVVVKKNTTTTTTEKQSATPTNEKRNAEKATKEFAPTDIINLPGEAKLEMVKVEASSFMMSAPDGENNEPYEIPHQVTLKNDFYIGRMEVTQAQWKSVMGTFNPSRFNMDDLPVDSVTWNEAMEFCEKLNTMGMAPKGWIFTLPTETQWEYAARGGKNSRGYKYSGSNSIDDVAWYTNNSGSKTHPVGKKDPNELGVYDMNGNVAEWCLDDWPDRSDQLKAEFTRGNDQYIAYRSNRGGGWSSDARRSRCASRYRNNPDFRHQSYGFRVALVPTEGLANASNQNKTEDIDNKSSSESNSTPKKNNPTYNPFGYTSPLMED